MADRRQGVSVIVATAREDSVMIGCTRAIARAAARLDEAVELIVVDDREPPVDKCQDANQMIDGLVVRRVWSRDFGVSGQPDARNVGVAAARFDIVALTDDDTTPDEHWLEFGVARLRAEPELAGVEGAIRLDRDAPIDGVRARLVLNEQGGACTNASMFYRTTAYRDVGGSRNLWFRPKLSYREDSDLAERVQRRVGPIAFEPRAFVLHPPDSIELRRLLQLAIYFRADAVMDRLHPGAIPSLRRRPLARLRIRLAVGITALLPGLVPRPTRGATALSIALLTAALSAQLEHELRSAGVRRPPPLIVRDTVKRLPRTLLWAVVAGTARLQSEGLVRMGMVDLPPERSTLFVEEPSGE